MRARLALASFVVLVALPGANMLWHLVPDAALGGVTSATAKPGLSWSALAHGEYQKQFEDWFNAHWGFRGAAVRTDNSISYYAFGETPTGSRVIAGRDRTLFVDEDITYAGEPAANFRYDEIVPLAQRIARLQARLREQGKRLLPILVPSKTALFPREVPRDWAARQVNPATRYDLFRRALDAAGVRYVDAQRLLVDEQQRRGVDLFARTGRHWTALGACLVLAEVRRAADGLDVPAPDCTVVANRVGPLNDSDYDLYQLMNVWTLQPIAATSPQMSVVTHPEGTVRALFVGTSFSWKLIFESLRNKLFRSIDYYYYNRSRCDGVTQRCTPLDATAPDWRGNTLAPDLYVLDFPVGYLPSINADFLAQLEVALQ